MTFAAKESSRTLGDKAEFYLFTYGPNAGDYYAYTTAEKPIVVDDITYQPVAMDRDSVKTTGTMDKTITTFSAPPSLEVGELFRIFPPSNVVNLIVWESHLTDDDAEFKVLWAGRIIGASWEEGPLKLTGEMVNSSMRRPGLRRRWQYGCGHVLYSVSSSTTAACDADREAATETVTVVSVDGAILTLGSTWATPEMKPKYLNGMVRYLVSGRPVVRRIVRINTSSNEISCSGVLIGLEASDEVEIILGCNHQMDDCKALHNNIVNFGGDPWIPTKSPFGLVNNFY